MKAGSLNWGRLQVIDGGNNPRAFFDLQNGVLGTRLSDINSSIEAVGNGWYRCSIVVNSSATQVRIYPADADADVSGTSGSIYIQNAQLESGLVATDYSIAEPPRQKRGYLSTCRESITTRMVRTGLCFWSRVASSYSNTRNIFQLLEVRQP